jgi:hypothetical protein
MVVLALTFGETRVNGSVRAAINRGAGVMVTFAGWATLLLRTRIKDVNGTASWRQTYSAHAHLV